jgi:hypothetical protein
LAAAHEAERLVRWTHLQEIDLQLIPAEKSYLIGLFSEPVCLEPPLNDKAADGNLLLPFAFHPWPDE